MNPGDIRHSHLDPQDSQPKIKALKMIYRRQPTLKRLYLHGAGRMNFLKPPPGVIDNPLPDNQQIITSWTPHRSSNTPAINRSAVYQQQPAYVEPKGLSPELKQQTMDAQNIRNEEIQGEIEQTLQQKRAEKYEATDFGAMNPYKSVLVRLALAGETQQAEALANEYRTLAKEVANYLSRDDIKQWLSYYLTNPHNANVIKDEWIRYLNANRKRDVNDRGHIPSVLHQELEQPGFIAQTIAEERIDNSKSKAQKGFERFGKVFSKVAEGLSTAVSFIPGIGTAVSAGLDAANLAYQYGTEYLDNKELSRQIIAPAYQTVPDEEEDDEKGGSLKRRRYESRRQRRKSFKPIVSGTKRMRWIKATKPLIPQTPSSTPFA